jgi:indole-3-glycerol phosphate synthase
MAASLDQITAAKRRTILAESHSRDVRQLERAATMHIPRGFRQALVSRSQAGPAVIAELKKASPSRGLIRPDFDAGRLAQELESAGAAALSVLTDEEFFQGSLRDLRMASMSSRLPCLRKDFILDEIQLVESRANQADAILLIVAALAQPEFEKLLGLARQYGLDVLCEVHDREELERARDAGCDLIGVNSRNLRTFRVDLETALRLAPSVPQEVLRVAESGIQSGADIARLRQAGYQAFLIGESLMQAQSPGQVLETLIAESAPVPLSSRAIGQGPGLS